MSRQIEEESLDPQDWEAMKQLGHRMIDDMFLYLKTIRDRPVWQPIPEKAKSHFNQALPIEPHDPKDIYNEFLEYVLPYPIGNIHPRFWGWVMGNGTPLGMLGEMLAAAINPNVFGANQIPVYVETQVIEWCKEMLGFSSSGSGILVSGGSMANLVGIAVARNAKGGFEILEEGVQQTTRKLTVYGSTEMHSSIQKTVQLLGLGNKALRRVPVGNNYRIDIEALNRMVAEDRKSGCVPICVVGNAGTVNTGAVDDLNELADFAKSENLWFHIDGSFGGFLALSSKFRHLVSGMERADSLGVCLHKWMHMQHEASCVLVKDSESHHKSFSTAGAYLSHTARGVASGTMWFSEYGMQLTRGFRALKIWMSMKEHGIEKFGRLVEQNIDQAGFLATLIEKSADVELLAPVATNVVCFRFVARSMTDSELNDLNREILFRLQEQGIAVPSSTTLRGKLALRVAITNHRSRKKDFEELITSVSNIGNALLKEKTIGFDI